jgi:hypothetical protein
VSQRLAADGWKVRITEESGLLAWRGGLYVHVGESYYSSDQRSQMSGVTITRAEPAFAPWLALVGLLLGTVAGWWLSLPVRRRALTRLVHVLWWAGLVLLAPSALLIVASLIEDVLRPATEGPGAIWTPFMFFGLRSCSMLGLVSLTAGLVAAWLPA